MFVISFSSVNGGDTQGYSVRLEMVDSIDENLEQEMLKEHNI